MCAVDDTAAIVTASVKQAIRERRLSQQEIGRVLGLSQQAVSDRINGRRPFKLRELRPLAEYLGVPAAELLAPPAVLVDDSSAVAS